MSSLTSGPSLQVHIPLSFKNNRRQKLTQKELIGKTERYLMKMKRTDYNCILQGTSKRHKKASGAVIPFSHSAPLSHPFSTQALSLLPPRSLLCCRQTLLFLAFHIYWPNIATKGFPLFLISKPTSQLTSILPCIPIPNGWGRRCHWVSLPSGLSAIELICPALAKEGRIVGYNDWASVQVYLWCYEGDSLIAPSQSFLWFHHLVLSSLWAPASPVGDSLRSFLLSIFPLHVSSSNRSLLHTQTQKQTKPCAVNHPPCLDIVPRNRLVGVTAPEIWNNVSW